jgi:S1-C subfamily serine protease
MTESGSNKPPRQESGVVSDSWQVVQAVLGVVMLLGAFALVRYCTRNYTLEVAQGDLLNDLQKEVHELAAQVEQLKQEQTMPGFVLSRYRDSIGYIYAVYHVCLANPSSEIRRRISGTGFLVGDGLLATNRHLAEPWYGDSEAEKLIDRGATTKIENLVVFFPGSRTPVKLLHATVSKTSDLAILRTEDSDVVRRLAVLPLAESSGPVGQLVTVIGYPMGIDGMVAKSPSSTYRQWAYQQRDIHAVNELAALSLIRPSTTYGHLGDILGDKLIYDAPTAHGGSGGPVFNSKGKVIGINSAYIDGFAGGTIGVSVESLRPLLQQAKGSR